LLVVVKALRFVLLPGGEDDDDDDGWRIFLSEGDVNNDDVIVLVDEK
jgi:hypothetical protein